MSFGEGFGDGVAMDVGAGDGLGDGVVVGDGFGDELELGEGVGEASFEPEGFELPALRCERWWWCLCRWCFVCCTLM